MRLAEMESHHDEYVALEGRIRTMVGDREFPAVFAVCVESFEHVVPTMKYRKQKGIEPETPTLLSFSVICKYAPPLFEHTAIDSLFSFVNSTRMLAKHENGYLQTIQTALEREESARVLWNHLEQQPGALQRDVSKDLGIPQETAMGILEVWEQLGVIVRKQEHNTYRLYFRTRFDAEVEGVCQTCGARGTGRKELFLKPVSCKECASEGYYHIKYTDAL